MAGTAQTVCRVVAQAPAPPACESSGEQPSPLAIHSRSEAEWPCIASAAVFRLPRRGREGRARPRPDRALRKRRDRGSCIPDDPPGRAGHRDAVEQCAGRRSAIDLAYLRTSAPSRLRRRRAATRQRRAVFSASCASCHRVNGRGGALGPDLSRIGASRSRELLAREIRTPVRDRAGLQPVTVVTKDGQRVRGARKTRTRPRIQIMDSRERSRVT